MKNIFKVFIVLLSVFALSSCANLDVEDSGATISVRGDASVSVEPDEASFTISATNTADTTEEARNLSASIIAEAEEMLLKQFSIKEEDISSSYISAYPYYVWDSDKGENVLAGQKVTIEIEVKLSELEKIGEIYTSLMDIDSISLSDITLDKKDKSAAEEEARRLAVEDAIKKAEDYLVPLGYEIKAVGSISDSGATAYYRTNGLLKAEAASLSDSAYINYRLGDIEISSSVSITFLIEKI